ncbi:MAG: hypothetical protein ACOX79_08930 [Methanosarcina sp.]|jgi:hypothetical protein
MSPPIKPCGIEYFNPYTIYSLAHHRDGIVHAKKGEARVNEAEFGGVTTEKVTKCG